MMKNRSRQRKAQQGAFAAPKTAATLACSLASLLEMAVRAIASTNKTTMRLPAMDSRYLQAP